MACSKETMALPSPGSRTCGAGSVPMTAVRSLGRPKDLEKRDAILAAAMQLFAERGLDGVSIEAIAAEASVSKVTVYANFKDKGAILAALVKRETARLDEVLASVDGSDLDLAGKLKQVGFALVDILSTPCHQALDRCLSMEMQRNPELARQFFEAGPGHLRSKLAQLLSEARVCGEMKMTCAQEAAEDLLGLWLGFSAVERRYVKAPRPIEEMRKRIVHGVDFYLGSHKP